MEEVKKENKVLKIFVLILCFAVGFGLGYYVVGFYTSQDKLEEKETPKEKEPEEKEEEEEQTPTVVSIIDSIDDYPTSSDNTVTDLGEIMTVLDNDTMLTNFKDITKTINGSTLNYNCEEYGEAMLDVVSETMGNACKKISVTVDNSFKLSKYSKIGDGQGGCSSTYKLYKTEKYYIYVDTEGCVRSSFISIYNKKGDLVQKIGEERDFGGRTVVEYFSSKNKPIAFVNNKMYYIVVTDENSRGEATLEMRSIDLSGDSLKETIIDEFEGTVGQTK